MKKLLLASVLAIASFPGYARAADDATYRFRPRQEIWQCNDIRVTWTEAEPGVINYDIGGTIWGGINFTYTPSGLFLRGIPCVKLR
jgi:hypothetical protein